MLEDLNSPWTGGYEGLPRACQLRVQVPWPSRRGLEFRVGFSREYGNVVGGGFIRIMGKKMEGIILSIIIVTVVYIGGVGKSIRFNVFLRLILRS